MEQLSFLGGMGGQHRGLVHAPRLPLVELPVELVAVLTSVPLVVLFVAPMLCAWRHTCVLCLRVLCLRALLACLLRLRVCVLRLVLLRVLPPVHVHWLVPAHVRTRVRKRLRVLWRLLSAVRLLARVLIVTYPGELAPKHRTSCNELAVPLKRHSQLVLLHACNGVLGVCSRALA